MKAVAFALGALLILPLPAQGTAPSAPSLLEAAEAAAASGAFRAQNTSVVATGLIREDDKKRSAIAYALSGAMAFTGAALWRWLPCRNVTATPTRNATENTKFAKCYEADGTRRGLEPPTKALLAAGVGLELVALTYFILHLRQDRSDTLNDTP